MNKTLTRKLIYVVVALTLLAMMIPAMAIPVSAAAPSLSMVLVDPITGVAGATPDSGYNIRGSIVQVTSDQAVNWSLLPPDPAVAQILAGSTTTVARVQGWLGNVTIQATNSGNETGTIDKKFGLIDNTVITAPGSSYVTWNEEAKAWQAGPVTITDTVNGIFATTTNVMQGAILDWYLLPGNVYVDMSCQEWEDHMVDGQNVQGIRNRMENLVSSTCVNLVSFDQWPTATRHVQNVTGANGQNSVMLYAKGEESVQIVCVAHYPGDPEIIVCPEKTSWDFYTTENEVVPQVRWAGEKIVLEKYFGPTYDGKYVQFALENQSVGALEPISANASVDHGTVWTPVINGFASAILTSSDAGVANVVAGLYEAMEGTQLGNQHYFTVYFLKFESLTIGDVVGKRVGHNCGLWDPANPWDTTTDMTTQTLNISQDALVRARVKGWFTNSNPSVRPVRTVDPTNSTLTDPETATLTLPAGRWILPDDWATLAGPNWMQSRIHWDIMCNPDGSVTASTPLGDYYKGATLVGKADVIGPFSPGLEVMTPAGWEIVNTVCDPCRPMNTVVPDGKLNWWDAPMPPAKVIYQIQDAGANPNKNEMGYFKAAMKTDIYYMMSGASIVYTNPFYCEMIPAHQAIPAFINNGGYDWNSFDEAYGPYNFWEFINQNRYLPIVASSDPAGHPTCVEVYSDNHGEAMVWLNGDWNQYMAGDPNYLNKGANDVPYQAVIGTTTVQATVDYPYSRLHQAFQSNMDVKTWLWGGLILGADEHVYANGAHSDGDATRMVLSAGTWTGYPNGKTGSYPNEAASSKDKVVWLWVTDRDGLRCGVEGDMVVWTITPRTGTGVKISDRTCETPGNGISQYNVVTQNIFLTHGFLSGTNGMVTDSPNRLHAVSYLRAPTDTEKLLFNKFWGDGYTEGAVTYNATSSINGLNPNNFCVAAIDLEDLTGGSQFGACNVTMDIYSTDYNPSYPPLNVADKYVTYETNVDFGALDPLDDAMRPGDANYDGVVNMGDVTAVERMILGYTTVAQNAILNSEGTVDMGTVVKIERTILGLK